MKRKVSIRQPLVLYAMVFVFLAALTATTIASLALVRGARRAYQRAATEQLRTSVSQSSVMAVQHLVATRDLGSEMELGLVTTSTPALGIDISDARAATTGGRPIEGYAIVRISTPGEEAYAIARLDSSIATSIAFVEVSRMIPLILMTALAIAAILAFMVSRLLLPSLDALGQVAAATNEEETEDLTRSETPNEIMEVAQKFRSTVRKLNEERKRIEEQKDDLARMQESLVRASKLASVGRLAAGVAHEIGNPLAAVRGYLSLLKGGLEPEIEQDVLERSVRELDRINGTIRKLLTYARQGEQSDEPVAPFATDTVIDDALALVAGHPALRNVLFDRPDTDERLDAKGHAGRLHQVLVNLLLNAGQALGEDPDAYVRVTRERTDDYVQIAVVDNGPGVDAELGDAIFDPFTTTKDPGEGTGLGLAVSRALMEAMDGDLVLDAEHTGGARFVVRVPRLRDVE
ncbi:MAG: ATP-binding protein [Deltaproteobacteria bacterium]